jgi:hypothetical protein
VVAQILASMSFAIGHSQAAIAHQLSVACQNVSRWHARWQAGGPVTRLS